MNTVKNAVPATADAKNKKGKPDESDPELEGLMSEIETDLREEELKKIWKNYSGVIVAFVVALIVGVAGFQMYREYDARQRGEIARRYELAVEAQKTGKTDEAMEKFAALAMDGGRGYSALARLNQAGLQVAKNDIDGALATYKALAADPKADQVFRDLAVLLRALHSLDREDAKVLEAALAPLTSPNNAFNLSALELSALLASKQGDSERAVKILAQITADPRAPGPLRERAEDLTKLYQSGATPAPPAAPAMPGPPAATPEAAAQPKP